MGVGTKVVMHGCVTGTVVGTSSNGKRVNVAKDKGGATWTHVSNVKAVA